MTLLHWNQIPVILCIVTFPVSKYLCRGDVSIVYGRPLSLPQ